MTPIRWGILGTGRIAGVFAEGLAALPDAQLVAVGSRTAGAAQAFATRYQVPNAHASYTALAADPQVDVVYVASPHPLHYEHTLTCLQAGKPVLCEKPFTLNTAQAEALISEARSRKLFLMEAMWTRFLPHIAALRELLAQGAIGEPRLLHAEFCYRTDFDPAHRLFDPLLGGGALLDVGVYPVSLAHMVFGVPDRVAGLAELGTTGVDQQNVLTLGFAGGQLALLASATRTATPAIAQLHGTAGRVTLHEPWWGPSQLTLSRPGHADQLLAPAVTGNGYNYQAAEVHTCLRAGLLESATMPHSETLAVLRTLDSLRGQWGLRYPGE